MTLPALDHGRILDDWALAYARTKAPCEVDFRVLMAGFAPERHTHMMHSYPAKLLPQIPAFFLNSKKTLNRKRTPVLADPFCGSGTVLLEGALRGFEVIGADTNPLARLIARVKTNPISTQKIREQLSLLNRRIIRIASCELPPVINLLEWYSAPIAQELGKLRIGIAEIESTAVREFMLVCLSACVRKMSCADPRLSVPVKINLARKTKYGQHFIQLKKHLDHLKAENVISTFNIIVEKNISRMESLKHTLGRKPTVSIFEDARRLHTNLDEKSVDFIITSPPYVGAQKYIRSSSLSLGWLDFAYEDGLRPLERSTIGREHFAKREVETKTRTSLKNADKLLGLIRKQNPLRAHITATYLNEMSSALSSMHRIIKRRGNLILVAGPNTICGYHFDTPTFIEQLAHKVGFRTQFKLVDHIRSRGLMTKRNKTAGLISSEIVLSLVRA
jgi:DNA modification methylase